MVPAQKGPLLRVSRGYTQGLLWGSGLIPGYAGYSAASGLTQNLGDTIQTTVYITYPSGDRCQLLGEGHAQVKF